MAYIDYYKIMGVDKTATQKEIKDAFRKLARKYHPDLNPNNKDAEEKFKEINEANEVLSKEENRKKYDQYGKDWKHAEEFEKRRQQQQAQEQSYGQGSTGGEFSGQDFSDYFESMFGTGRSSPRQGGSAKFKGQDFNAELHLDFEAAYETHQQILNVNNEKIRLTIPAGVENGQVIKIKDKGGKGINGGPNGNLYITFIIKNHSKFKRNGNNLYADADVDLYTALLGGEVIVDTFKGKAKVQIKPETQSGIKLKLSGKGFPVYKHDGKFGDLILTLQIKLPTSLSEQEITLFKELQKLR